MNQYIQIFEEFKEDDLSISDLSISDLRQLYELGLTDTPIEKNILEDVRTMILENGYKANPILHIPQICKLKLEMNNPNSAWGIFANCYYEDLSDFVSDSELGICTINRYPDDLVIHFTTYQETVNNIYASMVNAYIEKNNLNF